MLEFKPHPCPGCGQEMEMPQFWWDGYWCECDKKDEDHPWERFYLTSCGIETGDFRPTTEEDLNRLGFIQMSSVDSLIKVCRGIVLTADERGIEFDCFLNRLREEMENISKVGLLRHGF